MKQKFDVSVGARARATDPLTSHEAAASVTGVTKLQNLILRALKKGPLADHELISVIRTSADASESGIRSRRCELWDQGLISACGEILTPSGRRTMTFKTTATGRAALNA